MKAAAEGGKQLQKQSQEMAAAATMQNGYARHALSSFSSNGSANMTGGGVRGDSDIREAMHASLRVLQQFKESQAKLQSKVNTLEAEVGQMQELRERNRALEEQVSEYRGLFEGVFRRLELLEAASARAGVADQSVETAATKRQANGHQIPHSPSSTKKQQHTAGEAHKIPRSEHSLPPPVAPQEAFNGISHDMSRDSSQSSGKRVSFVGLANPPTVHPLNVQAADDEFDLFGGTSMKRKPVLDGPNGHAKVEDHSLLAGLDFHTASAPEVIAEAAQVSSPKATSGVTQSEIYWLLSSFCATTDKLREQVPLKPRFMKSSLQNWPNHDALSKRLQLENAGSPVTSNS